MRPVWASNRCISPITIDFRSPEISSHGRTRFPLATGHCYTGRAMGKYEDLRLGEDALPTLTGRAWCVGDAVGQRDLIDEDRLRLPPHELARRILLRIAPQLAAPPQPGDFLVAGLSFGGDVATRTVPVALRALPLGAVIARSFGATFLQNALRCGLPALVVEETGAIQPGDRLRVDIEAHVIANLSSGDRYVIRNIDDHALAQLRASGRARRPGASPEGG